VRKDSLAYRVQFSRMLPPLLLGASVHPIHVNANVDMPDASIRFVLESVVVADHRTAIVSAEELVQRGDDLALADVQFAGQINVAERAPSPASFSRPARLVSTSWKLDLRTTSCSFQKPFWRTEYSSRKSGRTLL
jgi:hypothetical protein